MIFNTLAELKTRVGTTKQSVTTLGYYTSGDEGGNTFYWDNSSTLTDNGGTIIQVTGVSTGRWIADYKGRITAKQFGAKGDYTQNDTPFLQKGIDWVVDKAGEFYINRGLYKLDSGLTVSTATTSYHTSFKITGAGAAYNNTAIDQISGTLLLLNGTGHTAIMDIRKGAVRYAKFENFTVSCLTNGGAEHGILWSSSEVSQHSLAHVHSWNANKAFSILKGSGSNGEFASFYKCQGLGINRFFYMDTTAGQAFNQNFVHCAGSVTDGGAIFEIGGSGLGYGFTLTEFESSNTWDNTTGVGITLIKNNGISGTINFYGGRIEAISTVISHTLGTFNQKGKINFHGVHFDGMAPKLSRPFITSDNGGNSAAYNYNFDNCHFSATSSDATLDILNGNEDATGYYFKKCLFEGFKKDNIISSSNEKGAIVFTDCRRIDPVTQEHIPFSRDVRFRYKDALTGRTNIGENVEQASGLAENLMLYSNFGVNSGAALSPWVHTGLSTFYEVRKIGYGGVNFVSPHSIQAIFRATSGVYQNIAAAPFNTSSQTYYYQALVSTEFMTGRTITISLENSSTNRVYEAITLSGGSDYSPPKPIIVTLKATDGNVGGVLRLRINNNGADLGILNINYQFISKSPNAVFVPTTSAAITGYTVWSQRSDMLSVFGALRIPYKTDETGSASTTITDLDADGSRDVYVSSTTGRLKVRGTDKWMELPTQDYGSAAPVSGTYVADSIRWKTGATPGGFVGWICTTGGTPGTWKTWGVISV